MWLGFVVFFNSLLCTPLLSSDRQRDIPPEGPRAKLERQGFSKEFLESVESSLQQITLIPQDREAHFNLGSKVLNYADTLFVNHLLGSTSFNYLKRENLFSYLKLLFTADEYLDVAATQGHNEARQALQLQDTLSLSIETSKGWYITEKLLNPYKEGVLESNDEVSVLKGRIANIVKKYAHHK
jgi:hypothetical protein